MIENILKKRTNHSFFRNDKIPDKEVINEILDKAYNLTPYKNNFVKYEIEVYGPNHDEEKKYLAMSTICLPRSVESARDDILKQTIDKLENDYDEWLLAHDNENTRKKFKSLHPERHFNNQVRAPYLLVYLKNKNMITKSQKQSDYYKSGKLDYLFETSKYVEDGMWLIQAGMHSMVTSMLSIEKGLDVSFCKCFFYNPTTHTHILKKAIKNPLDIAFMLGIGYADMSKYKYKAHIDTPHIDEIVKWN